MTAMNSLQDRIRGSLIGGAIGDALGYPVEFVSSYKAIQHLYGERGITRLQPSSPWLEEGGEKGKAVFADNHNPRRARTKFNFWG